jgi:hypothetical protein
VQVVDCHAIELQLLPPRLLTGCLHEQGNPPYTTIRLHPCLVYMKTRSCFVALLLSLCAVAHGQGYSAIYSGLEQSTVSGLQNGDLLMQSISPTQAVATRLAPDGAVVWSRDFAPAISAIWGAVELGNGELLCLIHLEDSPGVRVNGIMRLDASGTILRVRAFPDLPVDPSNPRRSYIILHGSDQNYHYAFIPSVTNNARIHLMSDQDVVLSAFDGMGSQYFPLESMVERDGYLYGVGVRDAGKLNFDGTVIWRKHLPGNTILMEQILSVGQDLAIRYVYLPNGLRPGLALMDTAGTIGANVVLDLPNSGLGNSDLLLLDDGLVLCAAQDLNGANRDYMVLCDQMLGSLSLFVNQYGPLTLLDATTTADAGVAMCGRNGTWTGDAYLARSGPDNTLGACWNAAPFDTVGTTWPAWGAALHFVQPASFTSELRNGSSVTNAPNAQVICSSVGMTDPPSTSSRIDVRQHGDGVLVISTDVAIASCALFDSMGRMVASGRGQSTRLNLPCRLNSAVVLARVALADGAVVTRKVLVE